MPPKSSKKKSKTPSRVQSQRQESVMASSTKAAQSEITDSSDRNVIPIRLQQHVLDVFRNACAEPLGSDLHKTVQSVKGHLYDRDFAQAFGSEQNLWAYAARWSPSRALAYLRIFSDISDLVAQSSRQDPKESWRSAFENATKDEQTVMMSNLRIANESRTLPSSDSAGSETSSFVELSMEDAMDDKPPTYQSDETAPAYENPPAYPANAAPPAQSSPSSRPAMTVTALGGGAGSEVVACAGWVRLMAEQSTDMTDVSEGQAPVEQMSLKLNCIDMAAWSTVVNRLDTAIHTPPHISKFASAAKRMTNVPLLPQGAMDLQSVQQDLLDGDQDDLRAMLQASDIVTLMFTLNELYTTSVSKTQRLLFEITVASRPGTLLLVVDSPGSYSTVTINGAERKYPMQWLLDHTLLETLKKTRVLPKGAQWEKVLTDDSRWFRMPDGLKYPIDLENMRYQIHLYRRLEVEEEQPQSHRS